MGSPIAGPPPPAKGRVVKNYLVSDTLPVASHTAEVHLILPGGQTESPSRRIRLSRAATLVACKITVSASGVPANGRRRPTLDDVLIRLESPELPLTKADDESGYDKYVSASALDASARYLMAELPGSPDVTIQASWKNQDNSTPIYEDSIVSVALIYAPSEAS